ncbi:MAG TPA: GyrI-like domain-containing protein [Anaerolineales bacterium]
MSKIEWKKDFKKLYFPPANPVLVEPPPMNYLMVDGHGDPNTSPAYQAALEALFSLAYTLKFAIKKAGGPEYTIFPLEGLWWVADMAQFTTSDKSAWDWTMMIAQPEAVSVEGLEQARAAALKKKSLPALEQVRFERFEEGLCAQVMHTGPYSAEGPTIARLHAFIAAQGCQRAGKHHEIYLGDVRRTTPEKLKTVIRQPMARGTG